MVQNIQISGGDEITKKSETSQTALEFGGEIKKKKTSKVPRMYTVEIVSGLPARLSILQQLVHRVACII